MPRGIRRGLPVGLRRRLVLPLPGGKFLTSFHEQVPASFRSSFLRPLEPYRDQTGLLMFEFSRFYPRDFARGRDFVDQLDAFLAKLPTRDWDFGVEIRNASLLAPSYFEMLRSHGVAHVYNQWQRMPGLDEQITLSPPDNTTAPIGSRLLLKCGRPYQDAVDTFSPYDRFQEPQPEIRHAAATLIAQTRANPTGRKSYVYVNNRLEGNALTTIEAIIRILDQI